jgi:hypothetical protein
MHLTLSLLRYLGGMILFILLIHCLAPEIASEPCVHCKGTGRRPFVGGRCAHCGGKGRVPVPRR